MHSTTTQLMIPPTISGSETRHHDMNCRLMVASMVVWYVYCTGLMHSDVFQSR